MKTILNYLGVLLVGIIIGIVCSIVVRSKLAVPIRTVTDTLTVITHDTVRITEPFSELAIPVQVKRFATVPTLLTISDTIKVPYYIKDTLMIPIEQRYYTTDAYKAWVSGYLPKLDSIIVYNTTRTQTITNTQGKGARNTLSIEARFLATPDMFLPSIGARYARSGLFAEVGGLYYNGIKPYVQVGYSFTIFSK